MTTSARVAAHEVLLGRIASDPGLLRLRLALRATLAVAVVAAVERRVGPAVGMPGVVAMLLGGMVGMQGSFASSSRGPRDVVRTLAPFPLVAAAGALPAALLASHRRVQLAGFVVVMVAAVFVRRYGPRGLVYGMLAWFCYFFATFLDLRPHQVLPLLAVVSTATAGVLLVAAVVVPDRPAALRAAARRSFDARVYALARTAHDVVTGRLTGDRAAARLHASSFRLVEAALLIDGYLADASPPDAPAPGVRRVLLQAELAADQLAASVARLRVAALPPPVTEGLAALLQTLSRGELSRARELVERLRAVVAPAGLTGDLVRDVSDAALAAADLVEVLDLPAVPTPPHVQDYEPAVTLLLGNLPASTPSVLDVLSERHARWSLNTRLCVQTALAATLTVVLGDLLSPRRYYWALLACFLVLTGTFTTGEAATKGANRVLGTVAGLAAATLAVDLTGSHSAAILTVLLLCVFVGLYFFRVSYAAMAFAVTTLMGELYSVLREFSDALLLLRLAETVVGAGVAVAVVLLVLPVSTAAARAAAARGFLAQLDALLVDVRDRLSTPGRTQDLLYDARRLDAALHQFALVARPAAGATLAGLAGRGALALVSPYTEVAFRARSLAAAVTVVEPGSRPDLAAQVEGVRTGAPEVREDLDGRLGALAAAVAALPPTPEAVRVTGGSPAAVR